MEVETELSNRTVVRLAELRQKIGRSQAEVASAIGTTQSGVSRIERQPDVRLSTLDQYVSALGGRLHLVVAHDTQRTEVMVPSLQHRAGPEPQEYRVIWQDPETRRLVHVGWLSFTGNEFVFSYTDEAIEHGSFDPFPAFPVFDETYRAADLFPFFSVRLTSTADPQFDAFVDALGLSRERATPAELLARSPSESAHDTIQVVPEPVEKSDGTLCRIFLASGVRHIHDQIGERLGELLNTVEAGNTLNVVPEPTNPNNPDALQLAVGEAVVGWVPNYLVDEVHGYLDDGRDMSIVVERSNGPEVPWHLRLLCRLTVKPSSPNAEPTGTNSVGS